MTIEILYAQSYMQTNGQMTVDILLKNMETADIVVGMDMYNTDLPAKMVGPRMVTCVPKNTPCYSIRYTNFPFTDPYRIYVKRCISGPNCAGPGCTTFGTIVDSTFMGDMVDFGSPGVSGVPSQTFGPNAKYSTGMPSSIKATCVPPPPLPITLNVTGVTAELSTSPLFPGSEGWTRINVTVTGTGMLDILVDDVLLLTDGPLNPGTTPFTFTYLKKLTSGTKHICVIGKSSTGTFGNQVCTSIIISGVVACKPPNDVYSYCDTKNPGYGYVWNQVACKYDYGVLNEALYHCGVVAPPIAGTFTISASKTIINIGDSITFNGKYYIPNTSINLYYATVVAGVAIPYRNHLATVLTDSTGNYSSSMILTTIIPGVIRVGACSLGSLGFECGSDVSSNTIDIIISSSPPIGTAIDMSKTSYILGDTVSIKVCTPNGYVYITDPSGIQTFKADIPKNGCRTDTYIVAAGQPEGQYAVRVANYSNTTLMEKFYSISTTPLPVAITLKADKTTITTGDLVQFTGTYSPNKTVNIFIEGLLRTHLAQVTTDSSGNFKTSLQITNEGVLQIKACSTGIGLECGILSDVSQAVSLTVNPSPTVSMTFYTNKTLVADGENLTLYGTYKPNTQINVYYQTLIAGVAVPLRNHFATVNTDSTGKYLITMVMTVSVPGTIRMGACSLGGLGFECGSDVSNTVDVTVTAAAPTAFTLVADKSSITSGDTVTFTGKYSPNKSINIYIDGILKTHITSVTTSSDGTYSTPAKLTSDTVTTVNIAACDAAALIECHVGGATSNMISISITPPGVTPPPTGLKWKLNPDLTCTQPTDDSGTYITEELCLADAAKKKGGISGEMVIGVAALAVVAVALMKKGE